MEKHTLDKGSFWLIIAATLLFLGVSVYDYTTLHWPVYEAKIFYYFGIVLFISGYCLRLYSRMSLQKQFSVFVALQKEHKLITTGVYHYVRHPIYSAGILSFIGFILLVNSMLGLIIGLLFVFPALLYRIHVEEKMLIEHFGEEYLDYKKRVKALIPWLI